MGQNVVGRWQVGGGWQVPLGSYSMLGICRLSVLEFCMKHGLHLLLRIAVRLIWTEKERSRIKAVQMDNLRGLLGIKRMDRVPKSQIRE